MKKDLVTFVALPAFQKRFSAPAAKKGRRKKRFAIFDARKTILTNIVCVFSSSKLLLKTILYGCFH
jgi:hypothetical protein